MTIKLAVPAPVAGPKFVEKAGKLYLHWQDVEGNLSENYALTIDEDPENGKARGLLSTNPPPEFSEDGDDFWKVVKL